MPAADLFAAVRARSEIAVRAILTDHPEYANARDTDGATPLHYAAEAGDRAIVNALIDAGAEINARDGRFGATPAGWAIEYLRTRGALLGMEIEDAKRAAAKGDSDLLRHYLTRLPALRNALASDGIHLKSD
jgi:hypothetical protein